MSYGARYDGKTPTMERMERKNRREEKMNEIMRWGETLLLL
jgi:hypothetical protein